MFSLQIFLKKSVRRVLGSTNDWRLATPLSALVRKSQQKSAKVSHSQLKLTQITSNHHVFHVKYSCTFFKSQQMSAKNIARQYKSARVSWSQQKLASQVIDTFLIRAGRASYDNFNLISKCMILSYVTQKGWVSY